MSDPKAVAASPSPAATLSPPAEKQSPQGSGSFRGDRAEIVTSKAEATRTPADNSASFAAINERNEDVVSGKPLSETPSSDKIRESAKQAKSGGWLRALYNLVRTVISYFLPGTSRPDAASSQESVGRAAAFHLRQPLIDRLADSRELAGKCSAGLKAMDETGMKNSLLGKGNMLAELIGDAESMRTFADPPATREMLAGSIHGKEKREALATKLNTAADAIDRLLDAQYTPASKRLRSRMAGHATLRDFVSADPDRNPYLILRSDSNGLKNSVINKEEVAMRTWLIDAMAIYDQAASLIEGAWQEIWQDLPSDASAADLQARLERFAGAPAAGKKDT